MKKNILILLKSNNLFYKKINFLDKTWLIKFELRDKKFIKFIIRDNRQRQ